MLWCCFRVDSCLKPARAFQSVCASTERPLSIRRLRGALFSDIHYDSVARNNRGRFFIPCHRELRERCKALWPQATMFAAQVQRRMPLCGECRPTSRILSSIDWSPSQFSVFQGSYEQMVYLLGAPAVAASQTVMIVVSTPTQPSGEASHASTNPCGTRPPRFPLRWT